MEVTVHSPFTELFSRALPKTSNTLLPPHVNYYGTLATAVVHYVSKV